MSWRWVGIEYPAVWLSHPLCQLKPLAYNYSLVHMRGTLLNWTFHMFLILLVTRVFTAQQNYGDSFSCHYRKTFFHLARNSAGFVCSCNKQPSMSWIISLMKMFLSSGDLCAGFVSSSTQWHANNIKDWTQSRHVNRWWQESSRYMDDCCI